MKDWIPLINKLVWPVIIGLMLLIFRSEVSELYGIAKDRMKSGSSIEIGGFLKLGEKASNTAIKELAVEDLSIDGDAGAVRKGSRSALERLQSELEKSPKKNVNTLLIPDNISTFSVNLLKEYVSTLNLKYVVYQESGKFVGWMNSGMFIAQLPTESGYSERDIYLSYRQLHDMKGLGTTFVKPTDSARAVLEKLDDLHLDALPVVDENHKWQFFAERGEILSRLMTSIVLAGEK